jgi:plasmid stabilization system protein ParE
VKLSWPPRAKRDVREIHAYIARHDKRAATRVVAAIRNTAESSGDTLGWAGQRIGPAIA